MKLTRLLTVFVAVLLISLAAVTTVSADDESQFEIAVGVSSSTAILQDGLSYVKPGEEIELTVSINENTGVDSFELHIKYNSELITPVTGSNGKVVMNGVLMNNCNIADTGSEIIFTRFSSVNDDNTTSSTGKTTVKFTVNEGVCGEIKFVLGTVSAVKSLTVDPYVVELVSADNKAAMASALNESVYSAHDYSVSGITTATCKDFQVDHYTCANCDVKFDMVREDVAKAEHTPVVVPGIPATCIADGTTDGVQCSECRTWIEEPLAVRVAHSEFVEDENGNWVCPICDVIVVERVPGSSDIQIETSTQAPTAEDVTAEVETKAPETDASKTDAPETVIVTTGENKGCGSSVGVGSIVIIAFSMIGAISFKKRKF